MAPRPSPGSVPHPDRRTTPRREQDRLSARRERELEAARRISQALSQHVQLDELVETALHTALEVLDAENGSLLLADPDTEQLVFQHSTGEKPVPKGSAFPWHEGFAGAVFKSGEPTVVKDARQDQRHYGKIDELIGSTTRDMIVFPLKQWEGEPIGVIEVMNKRHGTLDDEDVALLTIISALTAAAIEQARLFENAKLAEVARLMGNISHDVKNLLMPIVCGAGLLQNEINELLGRLPDIELARAQESRKMCNEVIDMLIDDARRISDRVKEIADCVKGLSSPPEFAPCLVADVVESVFKTLSLLAQEKGISLSTKGLDHLPPIQADERRLYNAFYNLVNNAIPEVAAGGAITVYGREEPAGGVILVSVADTGRGMPPEVRERLFTSRVISSKPGGTGLGTKIVKDVVHAHGGQISVESEVGVGTTVHIRLLLQPPTPSHSFVR